MDTPRYSLRDIFGFLHESTQLLERRMVAIEDDDGIKTHMTLREYVGLTLANELTDDGSRMASDETTAKKTDVIAAMKSVGYDDVAFPVYESFGLLMTGGRRSRTRKQKRV
jgi:hypothetical protein